MPRPLNQTDTDLNADNLLRLSIGIEDVADLTADLDQAMG